MIGNSLPEGHSFVFGSNESGRHGAGAAAHAFKYFGAIWGKGVGLFGQSYAIPTKDKSIETLPLTSIKKYVDEFLLFAKEHPELTFHVTAIGCGLAGYTAPDIAPMFRNSPNNCILPNEFLSYL